MLVPGFQGGAGDFALLGPELVRRVPGLQVWAVDRRSQALEDTRGFDTGDPDRALAYYLGGGEVDGRRFAPVADDAAPFAREWGLSLALADLRRVVTARPPGRAPGAARRPLAGRLDRGRPTPRGTSAGAPATATWPASC